MASPDKKVKKDKKVSRRVRETTSELKKVTWPSFSKVVKQTLAVLGIVVISLVALFGIDRLLSWLYGFLIG